MPKVSTYNITGAQTGEIELNDSVFGVEVNEAVMRQAVLRQLANERQGTHATKTRGLVRGGGRKPWKQKGTGRPVWAAPAAHCGLVAVRYGVPIRVRMNRRCPAKPAVLL